MSSPEISIILPTYKRADRLAKLLDSVIDDPELEVVVIHDKDDPTMIGSHFGPFIHHEMPVRYTGIQKWNIGLSLANPNSHYYMLLGDDTEFPPNWKHVALQTPNDGFVGFHDGHHTNFYPHYMMTRAWCKQYHGGVLAIPAYKAWYCDVETIARARRVSHEANGGLILHHNPFYGEGERDDSYRFTQQNKYQDATTFMKRQALGFPDDFEGVI